MATKIASTTATARGKQCRNIAGQQVAASAPALEPAATMAAPVPAATIDPADPRLQLTSPAQIGALTPKTVAKRWTPGMIASTPASAPSTGFTPSAGDSPYAAGRKSIDDVIAELQGRRNSIQEMTPDDLERARRQHRNRKLVAGITDAAKAVTNIIGTASGANYIDQGPSLSERQQATYDRLMAENDKAVAARQALGDKIAEMRLRKAGIDVEEAQYKEAAKYKEKADLREEAMLQMKQAEADREAEEAQLKNLFMLNKIDEKRYQAEYYRIKAKYADAMQLATIGKYNRSNTGGGKSGGSGGTRTTVHATDEWGNPIASVSGKDSSEVLAAAKKVQETLTPSNNNQSPKDTGQQNQGNSGQKQGAQKQGGQKQGGQKQSGQKQGGQKQGGQSKKGFRVKWEK